MERHFYFKHTIFVRESTLIGTNIFQDSTDRRGSHGGNQFNSQKPKANITSVSLSTPSYRMADISLRSRYCLTTSKLRVCC